MKYTKKILRILSIIIVCIIIIAIVPTSISAAKPKTVSFSTKTKVQSVKKVSSTYNRIKIKWAKMKKATGYQVYRATSKKGKYKKIATTKKTSLSNTNLKAGKEYYYKIRAYKKNGKSYKYSRFSSVICVKTSTRSKKTTESVTTKTTTEKPNTTESTTEKPNTTEDISEMSTQYIQDLNYNESTEIINNPDQGFYQHINVKVKESGITYDPSCIKENIQLYHLRINIGDFSKANNRTEDKELTPSALAGIERLLKSLKKSNKNAIVRFAYDDFVGIKDKEPDPDMIIRHIEQFAPILDKYPDTITAVEFGLIGPWGEMHSSNIATKENINKLMDTYLDNTSQLPILVRTPAIIYDYLGITINDIDNYIITNDSNAYRIGLFNDGYLGSDTDLNTYKNRAKEIPWLANQTSHLPYGGEVVIPDSPLHNIENCIPEMQEIHLSYLNRSWNDEVIDKWKNTYYTSAVGKDAAYYDMSAYEYIENHLGYRFVLENSVFEYSSSLSNIKINLDIKNVGFGNLNRTKKMTLLFVDSNGEVTSFDAGTFSGESQISIDIPINIDDVDYNVYLRIDNGNDQYHLRFANDLWNSDLNANQIGSITK